ncbi:helix-turn-helix domain-containing protein [Stenotrophomonas acidaminiphila]
MKLNPTVIRRLREARHWSQEQLAAAAGLSPRTVQRVETEGAASRETRVCLAAALDTDVSAILESEPGPSMAARWNPWMLPVLAGVLVFAIGTALGAPRVVDYCAILLVSIGVLGHSLRK